METLLTVLLIALIGGMIVSFILRKIKSIISFMVASALVSVYHVPNILDIIKKFFSM